MRWAIEKKPVKNALLLQREGQARSKRRLKRGRGLPARRDASLRNVPTIPFSELVELSERTAKVGH
jgi:hypothetical protein